MNATPWFRNARIYLLTQSIDLSAGAVQAALDARPFHPCGAWDTQRMGWVSPVRGGASVHAVGNELLVCLRHEEKILPPAVVREETDERVAAAEQDTGRPLRRKERTEIKEQVTLELLPKAFTKSRYTSAWISPDQDLVVVDAGSSSQAETLLSELREALGSLPVRPPMVQQSPSFTMTQWMNGAMHPPEGLVLGDECVLVDDEAQGAKVSAKRVDPCGDEIRAHLNNAMSADQLLMYWEDRLAFILGADLTIRRMHYGEAMSEALDEMGADDVQERFDTAFALMTAEFQRLIPALFDAFGGEDNAA